MHELFPSYHVLHVHLLEVHSQVVRSWAGLQSLRKGGLEGNSHTGPRALSLHPLSWLCLWDATAAAVCLWLRAVLCALCFRSRLWVPADLLLRCPCHGLFPTGSRDVPSRCHLLRRHPVSSNPLLSSSGVSLEFAHSIGNLGLKSILLQCETIWGRGEY